jgi:hypothetical protein
MLLQYHEIDPSPMATQQEKWLIENSEIALYGMPRKQFDEMSPDVYARFLAGSLEFDL